MYEKIMEDFIKEVKEEGTFATTEELREVLIDTINIINKYPDDTPEEIIERIILDNIQLINTIMSNYPIPGFTVGLSVSNINIKLYGGFIDSLQREMPDNALFDVASITKFYTQILAYNLIKQNVFSFDEKVKDLDPRFVNLDDLTVRDVLSFTTQFKTNGRLSSKTTIDEALNCLYTMNIVEKGIYNYNDMGMMLIKELMESITGKTYKELFEEYITNNIGLRDTYLIVPKGKIERLTGSPNVLKGMVNDPSALSVGGYSGNAGVFSSSDDLLKLGKAIFGNNVLPFEGLRDAYTHGIKDNRGVMGNTFTSHPNGINSSFVDKLEPITNFAIQGSTRVQCNFGNHSVSSILLNPASMSLDKAIEEERKINEQRVKIGLNPVSLVKHFEFDREGHSVYCDLIDVRTMIPADKTEKPISSANAKLILRLRLLGKIIENYDSNYNKKINIYKKL